MSFHGYLYVRHIDSKFYSIFVVVVNNVNFHMCIKYQLINIDGIFHVSFFVWFSKSSRIAIHRKLRNDSFPLNGTRVLYIVYCVLRISVHCKKSMKMVCIHFWYLFLFCCCCCYCWSSGCQHYIIISSFDISIAYLFLSNDSKK